MNTLKKILILGLFLAAAPHVFATHPEHNTPLRQAITKQVKYPDFAKKDHTEAVVEVRYMIHADGKVEVTFSTATNERFGQYVREKLESMQLKDPQEPGTHAARFKFRYL